eukprot:g3414.t1
MTENERARMCPEHQPVTTCTSSKRRARRALAENQQRASSSGAEDCQPPQSFVLVPCKPTRSRGLLLNDEYEGPNANLPLADGENVIGRGVESGIKDVFISRQHARVTVGAPRKPGEPPAVEVAAIKPALDVYVRRASQYGTASADKWIEITHESASAPLFAGDCLALDPEHMVAWVLEPDERFPLSQLTPEDEAEHACGAGAQKEKRKGKKKSEVELLLEQGGNPFANPAPPRPPAAPPASALSLDVAHAGARQDTLAACLDVAAAGGGIPESVWPDAMCEDDGEGGAGDGAGVGSRGVGDGGDDSDGGGGGGDALRHSHKLRRSDGGAALVGSTSSGRCGGALARSLSRSHAGVSAMARALDSIRFESAEAGGLVAVEVPAHVWLHAFCFLPSPSVVAVVCCCRSWRRIAHEHWDGFSVATPFFKVGVLGRLMRLQRERIACHMRACAPPQTALTPRAGLRRGVPLRASASSARSPALAPAAAPALLSASASGSPLPSRSPPRTRTRSSARRTAAFASVSATSAKAGQADEPAALATVVGGWSLEPVLRILRVCASPFTASLQEALACEDGRYKELFATQLVLAVVKPLAMRFREIERAWTPHAVHARRWLERSFLAADIAYAGAEVAFALANEPVPTALNTAAAGVDVVTLPPVDQRDDFNALLHNHLRGRRMYTLAESVRVQSQILRQVVQNGELLVEGSGSGSGSGSDGDVAVDGGGGDGAGGAGAGSETPFVTGAQLAAQGGSAGAGDDDAAIAQAMAIAYAVSDEEGAQESEEEDEEDEEESEGEGEEADELQSDGSDAMLAEGLSWD